MASVGNSSVTSLNWQRERQCAGVARIQPREVRKGWLQRNLENWARILHDSPFTFQLMAKTFRLLQRAGINITPNHFYWPVPDLSQLEKRDWPVYSVPPTCKFDIAEQRNLAIEMMSHYGNECQFADEAPAGEYHYNNGYFECVDAEIAYGMVRHFKPARIVEIGTGYSTRVLAAALQKNLDRNGMEAQFVSIDPFPARFPQDGWGDRVVQIPAPVQDVNLELFDELQRNDILFIDSSHVVAVGSDVLREYLQILPRLKPGVLVHVHDIFLPCDYPRDAVINNLWFWSEQYLLQAFLSFNSSFEVLWGSSAMQIFDPGTLDLCFPNWRHSYRRMPEAKRQFVPTRDGDRVWPSSLWMRRM